MFACSTLVAHGAYDWATRHELHTIAKDALITGDNFISPCVWTDSLSNIIFIVKIVHKVVYVKNQKIVCREIAQTNATASSKFQVDFHKSVILLSMSVTVKAFWKIKMLSRSHITIHSLIFCWGCAQKFANIVAICQFVVHKNLPISWLFVNFLHYFILTLFILQYCNEYVDVIITCRLITEGIH